MVPSSFTIDFHAHLDGERWGDFLLAVGTAGAMSHWLSSHRIELTCIKRSHLQHVGYIIFRRAVPVLGAVIAVSGDARNEASAYGNAR
jgi:hypothetical protein